MRRAGRQSRSRGYQAALRRLIREERALAPNPFPENPLLTGCYELAAEHHAGQTRKGGLPYLTHPVAVAKILAQQRYSATVLAAALLHDALEDTGCEWEDLVRVAGLPAARLVAQVNDLDKTVPWATRKRHYLRKLRRASPGALAVAAADKAHNAVSLAEGLRRNGKGFAGAFTGPLAGKIRNYRQIYSLIRRRSPSCRMLPYFREALEALENPPTAKPFGSKGGSG